MYIQWWWEFHPRILLPRQQSTGKGHAIFTVTPNAVIEFGSPHMDFGYTWFVVYQFFICLFSFTYCDWFLFNWFLCEIHFHVFSMSFFSQVYCLSFCFPPLQRDSSLPHPGGVLVLVEAFVVSIARTWTQKLLSRHKNGVSRVCVKVLLAWLEELLVLYSYEVKQKIKWRKNERKKQTQCHKVKTTCYKQL